MAEMGKDVLDLSLFGDLYSECADQHQGDPFHNQHINYFSAHHRSDAEHKMEITTFSKVYWFSNVRENIVLNLKEGQMLDQGECCSGDSES